RQKTELGADPARLCSQFARVVDRLLHGIDGAGRIGLRLRHPERIVFLLKALHAMPEITRLLPGALGIDEHRQIAAQSHRIHGLEEKGAMPAEQILHIVFRGRDQDVDPGLVHQTVEPIRIERDRRCSLLDDVEHDRSSLWTDRSAPCAGRAWVSEPAIIPQRGAIRPCPGRTPRRRLLYFGWMPAIVTASPHKAMSAAIIAANSSGMLPSGSTPNAASRSAKVASLTARDTSFAIRSMVSLGIAEGAISPFQVSALNPGNPDSAKVGTSVTASRRTAPLFACDIASDKVAK